MSSQESGASMGQFCDFFDNYNSDRRLVLIVLVVSLATSIILYVADVSREVMIFLVLTLLVSLVFAWFGKLTLAGWFAPFTVLIILVVFMFRGVGIRDTALLGLPVTIVAASLMNGRRGVLVFGLASLLVVNGFWFLEFSGLVRTVFSDKNDSITYIVTNMLLVLVTAMQWATISRLDERTRRAHQELQERKIAEEKLLQTSHQIGMLNELVRVVSETTELDSVLELIRQHLEKMITFDFYAVRIFNEENLTATFLAVYEDGRYWDEPDVPLKPGTHAYRVFETGESVLHLFTQEEIEHYKSNPYQRVGDKSKMSTSIIFVPLKRRGKTIGTLSVQRYAYNAYTKEHLNLVESVAIQVGVAIDNARLFADLQMKLAERKDAEQTLRRTSDRLATLLEISRAISSERDLSRLLETVYQESMRILPLDFFFIVLYDSQDNQLSFPIMYDDGKKIAEPPIPLSDKSFSGQVILSGQPLILNQWHDDDTDPHTIVGDTSRVTASLMFAPLQATDRVLGVISAQSYTLNVFDDEDLSLLTGIARQVATAIENARLFTNLQKELTERQQAEQLTTQVNFELQRRIKDLYILNAVSHAGAFARRESELLEAIVETLYSSLNLDIVGVAFWDEEAQVLQTRPHANRGIPAHINQAEMRAERNEGVVGLVAATRKPYRIKDTSDPAYLPLDPEIRSELCVPILLGEKLIGVLDMESKRPEAFGDADEHLLLTIAGQLASSLERLRNEQQLRVFNAELEQRVRDRTAELQKANQELEAFSYSVSHDLRAPLRAINGFARILQQDFSAELSPEADEFIEKIHASGQKMALLIDGLLNLSRVGRKPLNKQRVNPGEFVRQVIDSLASETRSRQVEWIVSDMPSIHADPVLFQQVYENLIGNAVKYTAKREVACIEIGSLEQDGKTIFFVRDNGDGFDMKYVDSLFGVFQRLHHDDEFEGTGIGLAIVRRIIEQHGGSIWAEARPGQGATFYFTLDSGASVPSTPAR
jgi:K+-sensing histidine kinase KdpD